MNLWQQFLVEQGARFEQSTNFDVKDFGSEMAADALSDGFIAPLTDVGLIAFSGEEAATFLHNQLTNDVVHLDTSAARLAAYCSPKGRMLASFLMWRNPESILLALPREIQAPVQKRLQMFILRSKVKVADMSDELAVLGIGGHAAAAVLAPWFDRIPAAPYEKTDSAAGSLIRVTDSASGPRYQWIASIGQAQAAWPELAKALRPVGTALWRLTDIQAGVPRIVLATQEKFVPQMINFEVIGGVNFKKGCYPGQEIVARSQYLGKLKRRMVLATVADSSARAGMDVFSSADPEQPCGMIVNAEQQSEQSMALLVEVKTASIQDATVHLGSASGPALAIMPLPYPLPDAA